MTSQPVVEAAKIAPSQSTAVKPTFSIGITAFNRRTMLWECLSSILSQSEADFEVIVGNDYVPEPLSLESLGINDARVTVVNYTKNLGEVGNLAALLEMAKGRYFTWLADDDGYLPGFLDSIHAALRSFPGVNCIFTSYATGTDFPGEAVASPPPPMTLLDGRDFLRRYLSRDLKVVGCFGVFETDCLRKLGGMEQLGTGFSPYSDNLLAIKCGGLERIAYVDAPLVFFRTHNASLSWTSTDSGAYFSAQRDLCERSLTVFRTQQPSEGLARNLYLLLRWCSEDYFTVMRRSRRLKAIELLKYLVFVASYAGPLGRYRHTMAATALSRAARVSARLLRSRVKRALLRPFRPHMPDSLGEAA